MYTEALFKGFAGKPLDPRYGSFAFLKKLTPNESQISTCFLDLFHTFDGDIWNYFRIYFLT